MYHVCSTTKIRNICYDFLWIMGDICYPCGSAVSYSTWNLRSGCTGHRNTDSHLCGISGHLCNRYCRRSGSRNGASVSSWDDKDWLDRICNECSDRCNWHHGSDNDAVEKDRKEGKNIFEKDQRTGFDGIGSRKGQNASR